MNGNERTLEYKGYRGEAAFDPCANLFYGEVVNIRDVVTFQAEDAAALRRAFEESLDDYLAFCQSRGEAPDVPRPDEP